MWVRCFQLPSRTFLCVFFILASLFIVLSQFPAPDFSRNVRKLPSNEGDASSVVPVRRLEYSPGTFCPGISTRVFRFRALFFFSKMRNSHLAVLFLNNIPDSSIVAVGGSHRHQPRPPRRPPSGKQTTQRPALLLFRGARRAGKSVPSLNRQSTSIKKRR